MKKTCYNCKYKGDLFKINGMTHLHCKHPKYKKEDLDNGKITPWDTLRAFWDSCKHFRIKN